MYINAAVVSRPCAYFCLRLFHTTQSLAKSTLRPGISNSVCAYALHVYASNMFVSCIYGTGTRSSHLKSTWKKEDNQGSEQAGIAHLQITLSVLPIELWVWPIFSSNTDDGPTRTAENKNANICISLSVCEEYACGHRLFICSKSSSASFHRDCFQRQKANA